MADESHGSGSSGGAPEESSAHPASSSGALAHGGSGAGANSPKHSIRSPDLAPLEYLQQQRRGSITDPSLHAASSPNLGHSSTPSRTGTPLAKSSEVNGLGLPVLQGPRPAPSYVFGDATPRTSHASNDLHRKGGPGREIVTGSGSASTRGGDAMNVDTQTNTAYSQAEPSQSTSSHFDPSRRRHSIQELAQGTPLPPGQIRMLSAGSKRKMSKDANAFAPVDEEPSSSHAAYPGLPSGSNGEMDGPAPKRRGSTADTQRIGQLSLYDRRHSVDSRGPNESPWWTGPGDRGSPSTAFPNPSYGSPTFAGSPSQSRPPAGMPGFSWSNSEPHSTDPASTPTNTLTTAASPGDARVDPSLSMLSNISFDTNRRMSITGGSAPPSGSGGPSRPTGRSDSSAPPIHETEGDAGMAPPPLGHGAAPPGDLNAETSSSGSTGLKPPGGSRDGSSQPYSRSPELRVSHKLAERKRRKEMKELFDELRDHLPADRGMKSSKWEILSKAIDFVGHLKENQVQMAREISTLRSELEAARSGVPFAAQGAHPMAYNAQTIAQGFAGHSVPGDSTHPEAHAGPLQNIYPPPGGPASAPVAQASSSQGQPMSASPVQDQPPAELEPQIQAHAAVETQSQPQENATGQTTLSGPDQASGTDVVMQ